MILRDYQQDVMAEMGRYLGDLRAAKSGFDAVKASNPEFANQIDYPEMAWKKIGRTDFNSVKNGLGEPLANVWLRVPTGGGKTLLATHCIGAISEQFLDKQTGLVVWVVPSTQIYRQTLKNLQDKQHPYRQTLDMAAAGRVMICEKTDKFTLEDVATHLVILVVMSQSVMVRNKEGRKVFRDNTGYTTFFPAEDAYADHEKLLEKFQNLDYFPPENGVGGKVVKTSLGNVLRISSPIIIVDEGHKNKSLIARDTLLNFNPIFMLELSATPPIGVNCLVNVSGSELNDEEMIKLDLNVTNKHSSTWQQTVAAAKDLRDELEKAAENYRQNSGAYIRPIALIQVERTGKDQLDEGHIHAEHAKDYLHKKLGVPLREIAIKSSEKDDIEGIDLMSEDCPIRYIITKQALQEGWDCSFAYVLAVLGTSKSETALTQLVGRILRQPCAAKTGVKLLDESYVQAFQQETEMLVATIKKNLENEGLGDIVGRLNVHGDGYENPDAVEMMTATVRQKFAKSVQGLYLPVFAVFERGKWRELYYEKDILAKVDFDKIELFGLQNIPLETREQDDDLYAVGYGEQQNIRAIQVGEITFESELDAAEMTRRMYDIVPNPWIAFDLVTQSLKIFTDRYDEEIVAGNLLYISEQIRQVFRDEIDRLARGVFEAALKNDEIKFYIIKNKKDKVGEQITFRYPVLNKKSGEPLERSLFDKIPSNANDYEKDVMWYMDKQENLLWWYRNIARAQYGLRGWKSHAVYPDFVAARADKSSESFDKIYVLETKGDQLVGNLDTTYKQDLFDLCNAHAQQLSMQELLQDAPNIEFHLVKQSTWRQQIDTLLKN
jgi:type III restriction enzyme